MHKIDLRRGPIEPTHEPVRWHQFEGFKVFRLEVFEKGKMYMISLLLNKGFTISGRWVEAWTEKFLAEVRAGEWDHHHSELQGAYGRFMHWDHWWDRNWKDSEK